MYACSGFIYSDAEYDPTKGVLNKTERLPGTWTSKQFTGIVKGLITCDLMSKNCVFFSHVYPCMQHTEFVNSVSELGGTHATWFWTVNNVPKLVGKRMTVQTSLLEMGLWPTFGGYPLNAWPTNTVMTQFEEFPEPWMKPPTLVASLYNAMAGAGCGWIYEPGSRSAPGAVFAIENNHPSISIEQDPKMYILGIRMITAAIARCATKEVHEKKKLQKESDEVLSFIFNF